MKKIIVVLAVCFVSIGFAQSKKEKALTRVTEDVCECVSEQDLSTLKKNALEMQLGVCIAKAYAKNKKILKDTYDISFTDEASMEAFGEEIGMKMLEVCPQTLLLIAQDYIGEDFDSEDTLEGNNDNTTMVSGKVEAIVDGQFNTISFTGENKREYKLLWMEYFQGQELLSDLKDLKKKTVKVLFAYKEMYDPKLKDYRTYKVLRRIEVIN